MPLTLYWHKILSWLTLDRRLSLTRPVLLVIGSIALILGLVFPSRWMLFLVYCYLLLMLVSYLWVRILGPRLHVQRQIEGFWVQVGDELEERWSLENRSPFPLYWLELDDGSNVPGYNARRIVSSDARQQQSWRTSAVCTQRGIYKLGPLHARFSDPLDFFCFEWREQAMRQLVVYPPLVRLPTLPLPRGQRGGLAQADLLQLHATPSVGGLRDYTPGDPPSRIHWPHVARHQRLVVKEFDQERAGALWLMLDLAAAAYPTEQPTPGMAAPEDRLFQSSAVQSLAVSYQPATLLELAITITASLAARSLAEGRTVGLICNDGRRRMVRPGPSSRQLWPILNELVDCKATGQQSLNDLLRQGPEAHGQQLSDASMVVITPDLSTAWLPELAAYNRRPGSSLVLLIAQTIDEAASCAALLQARGIGAQIFVLGSVLALVNPPRRPVTARVSALGRVVRV